MATARNILKNWFSRGKKPTGAQFSDLIDSFWHKDEVSFNPDASAAISLIWQAPVANAAALATTYPEPETNWAAMVSDIGFIYAWNGEAWKSTGLKSFPADVALKGGGTSTVKELEDGKVDVFVGKNLVNRTKGIIGYFYLNVNEIDLVENASYNITERIPVTENLIANHSIEGSGICNVVRDSQGVYLRKFDTQIYIYENGDATVEFSYQVAWDDFQVEKGEVITSYEPYTDKADIVKRLKELESFNAIEIDLEKIEIVKSIDNGAVARKYGIDIPSGSVGNNSYLQVRPFSEKISGSYKVDVILNHIGHNYFMVWENHINTSLGAGVTKFSKTFDDIDERLNIIIFPNNLSSGTEKSFRVSKVFITPLNVQSKFELERRVDYDLKHRKQIDVSKGFNSSTEDWNVTRFSDIIQAWEVDSIDYLNGRKDRKTIFKVMPGVYDEFERKWKGNNSETGISYFGIIPKHHQFWESFDTENPELTELRWDGYAGFTSVMDNSTHVMRRAIFHISDWIEGGVKCGVKGFKIWSKNTRYCVHSESAGSGKNNHWTVENCILEWQGRPNGTDIAGGTHIGFGISPMETGVIKNVKCVGIVSGKGFSGHNNGWSSVNLGAKPFITDGAKLIIENCDLGDGNIHVQTISNDSSTPDSLYLINCNNIENLSSEFIAPATYNSWKANVVYSNVKNRINI